ncbi:MAG TPA: carboxypeptidase-like regulatory domain-containing protein [Chitinophagaceae bacterium]|nr:carboxypeptidase-like regulatory domain-containing protein [Chitinophagaceae bacterium]
MLLLKSTLAAFLFSLLAFSPAQETRTRNPVEIKGIVVNAETGKPIPGIYLFVTEGEEEALTDAKGEFRIKTWKPLPLVLTSQNSDYHTVRLKITQASGTIAVKLRRK